MSEELDKPHIVNNALIDLGEQPAYSVGGTEDINAIVDNVWPRAVARAFGLHNWHFCRRTTKLAQIAESELPGNGYSAGFEMPGDRLGGPLGIFTDPRCTVPLRSYLLEERFVYANHPALWGRFKVKVDPRYWDDTFADAFTVVLAGMMAKPVKQDEALAADLMREALGDPREGGTGGLFGRLIAQDRAAEPMGGTLYADDPLTLAHGGGSWHGG